MEANFTCAKDHHTSIFSCPQAKFTCPGQSDLGFSCPTGFHLPSYYNKALHVIYTGQNKIRLSTASLNLLCLIIFRLLMDVFNLQSCKSSSEWSNHEESVSTSWSSHPISAAGEWLPWFELWFINLTCWLIQTSQFTWYYLLAWFFALFDLHRLKLPLFINSRTATDL